MGLTSLFKRKNSAGAAPSTGDDVERARTRARQRLIGAVVLVGIGIIGFPLLFETHPRPVPIDIPIEIANKDKVVPLAMPPARESKASAAANAKSEVIIESASDAGRELPVPPSEDRASTTAGPVSTPVVPPVVEQRKPEKATKTEKSTKPEHSEKPAAPSTAKPATGATSKPAPSASGAAPSDAARARALLEGKDSDGTPSRSADATTMASSGRFIVQVGAFAEANAARDARQKVEKLGLKTYTQVVETSSGQRIRVRVGPFASRDEADRAAGKLKSAGLAASLLAL